MEEVLQKLRTWLSPSDPSINYNTGLDVLHKETTTWFLEGSAFQEWHSKGTLLWINAKRASFYRGITRYLRLPPFIAGAGKSILWSGILHFFCTQKLTFSPSSAIIKHIKSLLDAKTGSIAYFYFDFRDINKRYRRDLLPSLLIQFSVHSIPCCEILSRVYSAHGKGTQQPSDEALTKSLKDMLAVLSQHPVYIVIDALDECPDFSGVQSPRECVLNLVDDLVNLCLPNLQICVTSRLEVDIRNRLESLTDLSVSLHDQTGHKEDITKYISSVVDFIAKKNKWREDDKELVLKTLSEKADGM